MRKLKKFKRYDEGGAVGAGSGDPFSYTDFSNRERNLRKPSEAAPIEERKPPKAEKEAEPVKAEPEKAEPAKTEKVEAPKVSRNSADDTAATSFNYPPQREQNPALDEAKEQGRRAAAAFKPAAPKTAKPAAISRDSEAGKSRGMKGDGPPVFSTSSRPAPKAASPNDIPGTDASPGPKGELIDNSNLAAKQLAQSTLGATAVGRGLGAGVRGAMGLGRMFESASKPSAKSEPKQGELFDSKGNPTAEATRVSPKREPKQGVLFDEAGQPTAAATRSGPKPTPKEAPKEAPKETPTRVDPRAAANRRAAESKGKEAPKESPTRVDPRAAANRRAAESKGKEAPKEAPQATSTADDEVVKEAAKRAAESRRKVTPKRQEDSAKFGGGKGTPSKSKTKAEVKPTSKKFDKPVGEKEGPTVDKVLESKGLSAKKGGKIPAFKKGGLVGRADGCAIRGKTKGRMV